MTTEETLEDLLGDEVILTLVVYGTVIASGRGTLKKSGIYYRVNDLNFHPDKVTKFHVLDHVVIYFTL